MSEYRKRKYVIGMDYETEILFYMNSIDSINIFFSIKAKTKLNCWKNNEKMLKIKIINFNRKNQILSIRVDFST